MANGRAAMLPVEDPLSRAPFLAVAELTGRAAQARILAACALTAEEVEAIAGERIETRDETIFDAASASLRRRAFRRLGAIRLSERNLAVEPSEENARMLARGVAALGVARLPWTKSQMQRRDRVAFLRRAEGDEWPDLSDAALAASAEDWLAPFIEGRASLAEIAADDLEAALAQLLPYELSRRLDAEAPPYFETPAGARHALDYAAENGPILAVRVQELYGLSSHPTLARGRAPLDARTALAGASADPDDARSAELLERLLERGEEGDERALSAPSLAGRSGGRAADDTRQAAGLVNPAAERSAEPYGALAVVARAASRGNRSIVTFAVPVLLS